MSSEISKTDLSNLESNTDSMSEAQKEAQLIGFAVEPKLDCPHFEQLNVITLTEVFNDMTLETLNKPCKTCNHIGENWICLHCTDIFCSRYINKDMAKHVESNQEHCLVFSFSDGSFWCYKCDNYISNKTIKDLQKTFSKVKHGGQESNEEEEEKEDDIHAIAAQLLQMHLNKKGQDGIQEEFTYQNLIDGLRDISPDQEKNQDDKYNNRQFNRIVFLTGAGISVSAGIPDFRTPGSGLYSQLQKYKLPYPEAIFEINYFKHHPQPFYTLCKEFSSCGSHFTSSHFFIAETNRRNRLLINFSQNIDGLELEAGLPESKLVQAHGHFRTAKCVNCKKVADIELFNEAVKNDKICYCKECEEGIVKPDIVFFGESLPQSFFQQIDSLNKADLVFVMGTSLKVFPFAALVDLFKEDVPIVLINRENPGIKRRRFLFLEGEIDDNVEKIMKDISWDFPEIKRTYPEGTVLEKKQNL
ncbi:SIR2 family histone deacetylase, putative (macronuclear) [Tetrahymena thermophila SB210]|uniref:SIR2 family histone deacetylase, putative n=2 Tax=Tetrahymena thermophila TaxID=5911 RepID=I7M4Q7_TETTS|nr:SIR2 family histone deacetylase, putative [Tetrahymena thermophila SB210]ADM88041.1 histone deacetylase 14 [Tetrahymena thermophila]EAS07868.1 SIR2 family histone deacetylase, putative [Tetrahymena thermophila SB210]|eukprot:XP_001028110.1 SIR2 family histone deacetylase, putative [Tetrahymena thermophila SB210]